MWFKALVLSSNKEKREDLVLVPSPNCFLGDCKVHTEEEKGEEGNRLGGHNIFGLLVVPVAAPREPSVAVRPPGQVGWVRVSPRCPRRKAKQRARKAEE